MNKEEYIAKIENLLETDLDQAMNICEEGLTKFPDTANFYYLKALILWKQSEVFNLPREKFSALLKKATDLDSHYSAPHYLWAYANELLGYPELALRGYQRAVEADPKDMEALGKVGEMEQKLGNLPSALKTFDKLISLLPSPSDKAYNDRGHIRRDMKDYSGAIEDFNKVLEINPNAGGSLWGRGLCKKELGDLTGAVEDFSQFITLFPQHIFGYMDRAAVKVLQNDLIGALKDYQTVVIQIDPKNDEAWERIANLQNQLVQQIPEGTPVLHSTLKSGHKAMTAPINGEMVVFLDMPQVEPVQATAQDSSINTPDQFGETPLVKAVKKGQVEDIKNLIAQGADVNFVDQFKESVLMLAVKKNYLEIVKLLVEAGADANYKDTFGKSILQAAEQKGYTEIANFLKSIGTQSTEEKNFKGLEDYHGDWTSLGWACLINDVPKVKQLIAEGVDVNERSSQTIRCDDRSICGSFEKVPVHSLVLASERGHTAIVKLLIAAGVKDENIINEAVERACNYGHLDTLKCLVNAGASIEGNKALRHASANGYVEMVKFLLSMGVKVTAEALDWASGAGHVEIVKILLAAGAKEPTALTSASGAGHIEIVKILLAAGVDITGPEGAAALECASREGHTEIVKMLLATGVSVTPNALIVACKGGHVAVVQSLLDAGADVNLHGKDGTTPLIAACKNGNISIIQLLLDKKADVNAKDNAGSSALMIANEFKWANGYKEIINLLKSAGGKE